MAKKRIIKQEETDYHIKLGNRLRIARVLQGLCQEDIGKILGITFQQVQKYEKGLNRISPYKLKIWAKITEEDVVNLLNGENESSSLSSSRIDVEFVRVFQNLSEEMRTRIVGLMRSIVS